MRKGKNMSASDQFQTIVYDPATGEIAAILPSQYIKSHASLVRLVPAPEGVRHKFFYLHDATPLDPAEFVVQTRGMTCPPALRSHDGTDPTLSLLRSSAMWSLAHYDKIVLVFEGGMGDYMDQADVVIELKSKYPDKTFMLALRPERYQALQLLQGFDGFKILSMKGKASGRSPSISFDLIGRMGGCYPRGGKVGVYSAIAGLAETAVRAPVTIPVHLVAAANARLKDAGVKPTDKLIALHSMSGNSNTKSISPAGALALLAPLLEIRGVRIVHLGGAGEDRIDHKKIISLQGDLSWTEVFGMLACCDGCVCIDSAIMHIAQHLNIPIVSLWGPTAPRVILDDPPGMTCIISLAPCSGCGQYDCSHATCMGTFGTRALNKALRDLVNVDQTGRCGLGGVTNA